MNVNHRRLTMKSAFALVALISTIACGTEHSTQPGICIDAETSEDGVQGDDTRMWLPCVNGDHEATCDVRFFDGVRTYQRADVSACGGCYGDELVAQHPEICPQGGAQ